jgi:hypothetical protein
MACSFLIGMHLLGTASQAGSELEIWYPFRLTAAAKLSTEIFPLFLRSIPSSSRLLFVFVLLLTIGNYPATALSGFLSCYILCHPFF